MLLISDIHAQIVQHIQSLNPDFRQRVRQQAGNDVKPVQFSNKILDF